MQDRIIKVNFYDGSSVKVSAAAVSKLNGYHAQQVGEYFDVNAANTKSAEYEYRVHSPRGMLDFISMLTKYFGG